MKKLEREQIIKQLQPLGCNRREAEIYLQCLQSGPSTVQELARALGYNRVTVHSAVEQLANKGFVFESRKGKKRTIAAEPPSALGNVVERKQGELQQMRQSLDSLSALLSHIAPHDRSMPTVKFFEGAEGFKRMLQETLSAKGEVLVFSYVPLFSRLVGLAHLEHYFAERASKGIHTRLIFPPCGFANRVNKKAREYRIRTRLLPPELHWQSGIFSWNNSLALMSYTQEKLTCTIIENEDIAVFYRAIIFELAWDRAKPI